MIQDLIVMVLVLAAVSNIVYQLTKMFLRKKEDEFACGGCEQCQLKNSLIHHDRK